MVYRKESLLRRIEKLREYRHDLREMRDIPFEQYVTDKKVKYSIERLLFLIAENILDSLDHLLSARFETISDSYEEIIENAYKRGLLTADFHSRLRGLGSLRNILAHEYLNLSDDEVYRNFKKMTELIDEIIGVLEGMI